MHRWKLSALACAAIISAALSPSDAAALTLGTLSVQSALGENLRAEISLPQATADEINSLAASIASPEVFRAQGMDYSASANAISVTIQRNTDGTASLRLTSNTPITEPFVDLVLQTQWNAGQLMRNYTLLLDQPPSQRSAPAPTSAQVTTTPASVKGRSYSSKPVSKQRIASSAAATSASQEPMAEGNVRVRSGDTAGRIANTYRPAGVSLDQMLVAMLRSNPKAFINGNVNRMRAGAVLQMPNREQALETSVSEARSIVAAQSRDFNAYRRSLAAKAPKAVVQNANRSASGKVQAQVAETRPTAEAPDKLTLSKGNVQNAAAEAQVAAQKQTADQDNRLSELQRNLAELNELAQNSPAPAMAAAESAPAASATAPAPVATQTQADSTSTSAPGVAITSATLAQDAASTSASEITPPTTADVAVPESNPATTTDQATASPAPEQAAVSDAPVDSTVSTVNAAEGDPTASSEALSENKVADPVADSPSEAKGSNLWLPVGAGLLAALLAGLGYTVWKRRRDAQAQAVTTDDAQPYMPDPALDSGAASLDATHAGSLDAAAATATATAIAHLNEADPIAEAEMYLAYGRDVQAEEILTAALQQKPEDAACALKLAEIYVKRQDLPALEALSKSMQQAGLAESPQWQQVLDMGRTINPSHPYFASVGTVTTAPAPSVELQAVSTSAFAAALNSAQAEGADTTWKAPAEQPAESAAQLPELDWNLDLPAENAPADIPSEATSTSAPDEQAATIAPEPTTDQVHTASEMQDLDLDLSAFDLPEVKAAPAPQPVIETASTSMVVEPEAKDAHAAVSSDAAPPTPVRTEIAPEDIPTLPETSSIESPQRDPAAQEPQTATTKSPEIDLGSLDLDLGDSIPAPAMPAQPLHNLAGDPLSTKLDLAQEFNSIGDSEGARTLIEEVLAEASGPLKERAQKMLSELD